MRPVVYVAGPLSGDVMGNTSKSFEVSERLWDLGFAPINPHLTVYWEIQYHHDYEDWLEYDFALIARSEALYCWGASPGADREVAFATANEIPVFTDLRELREAFDL